MKTKIHAVTKALALMPVWGWRCAVGDAGLEWEGKALWQKNTAVVGLFTQPALQWSGLVPTTLSQSPQAGIWP